MIDKNMHEGLSRRDLLKAVTAFAMAYSARGKSQSSATREIRSKILAYVGTYTGAVGSGGNGEGIYLFELDRLSGQLTSKGLVAKTPSPSWIAIHPSRKYLYAVNEIADFNGGSGSVSAFAIENSSGNLKALNSVSSGGAGPAHLSIDNSGRFVFVANYGGGSIAVLPILAGGLLGDAVDVHRDTGFLGGTQPTNAPRGSFAISGHDACHAHMIAPDPENKFVLATDLGQDRIYTYAFNPDSGNLTLPAATSSVSLPPGDGPRHFAFHPKGHWLYSIQEEASNVVFFRYDASTGSLTPQQTISTLPAGFTGSSFASEILISPNGKTLYAANRLHDTIAVFSIEPTGKLRHVGETSTMGDYPSQCRIDPTGGFLYACNRRSDNITSFRINSVTGLLTFTGQYTPVGSPGCITFL